MSSFSKNLIPRRIHKERSQPQHRAAKHGFLEKKKDYKLRARDRNRKQLRLKLLKEKASFRNPDEFYHAMIRSSTHNGRVASSINTNEKNAIPLEQRDREQRLLAETQDRGYVAFKHALEEGKMARLKHNLHFVGAASNIKRKHVVFADDDDEADQLAMKLASREEITSKETDGDALGAKRLTREQKLAYRELTLRTERRDKLKTVLNDLESEKLLLSKGQRVLKRRANPRTGAPAVYRWRQERKR